MKPHFRLSLALAFMPPTLGFGAGQQVVVYSFITDAGRRMASPTKERPARCALGSGGYREWGGIRAGETATRLEQIDPLVRAALQLNAYEPLRRNETPDVVVVFHWGCMRPDPGGLGNGRFDLVVNQLDMLDLVGGRVLGSTNDPVLRSDIIDAAAEERYFLIVSAFEPTAYARDSHVLWWRTQISVPTPRLTQAQAFPILAGVGATLFGRDTPVPRFIAIDVAGTLRAALQGIAP